MRKILLSILLLLTLMPAAQAQKMGEAKETDTNLIKAALKLSLIHISEPTRPY